jgi:hypothetical protein
MHNRSNDIEVSGVRIQYDKIVQVQQTTKQFPSIRFLWNPWRYADNPYFEISFGGNGEDINGFQKAIMEYIYEEKHEVKKSWFQKIIEMIFGSRHA